MAAVSSGLSFRTIQGRESISVVAWLSVRHAFSVAGMRQLDNALSIHDGIRLLRSTGLGADDQFVYCALHRLPITPWLRDLRTANRANALSFALCRTHLAAEDPASKEAERAFLCTSLRDLNPLYFVRVLLL